MSDKKFLIGHVRDLEASRPVRMLPRGPLPDFELLAALTIALERLARMGLFETMDKIAAVGPRMASMVRTARAVTPATDAPEAQANED